AAGTDLPGSIGPLGTAFAFGLGLALAITAFGHISGGHYNPAVTLGLMVVRKHPVKEVIPYWIAQVIGGFLAMLVIVIVFEDSASNALDTNPGAAISDWGALVLEIVATALFLMVILTVATDKRAPWNGVLAPLLIGLFIFTAANAVGPSSGGSFNPARSLTPVLWNQDWSNIWIYLVGPAAGAVLGASIWSLLLEKDDPEA
ncbi:MAG: aquaporin, partial [Chloroflexi bacterium]|nr:aquaporin [Chloroflexota bacterium]